MIWIFATFAFNLPCMPFGRMTPAFTVPLKASEKLGTAAVDAVADAIVAADGGVELCILFGYCTKQSTSPSL